MDSIIIGEQLGFGPIEKYPPIQIPRHQTTFLYGPSGCGKSTLARMMNATLSPSQGQLIFSGKPYEEWDVLDLRQKVILASQNVFLFDQTIQENFKVFYEYRELTPPTPEEMTFYLNLCCLSFSLDRSCEVLSGGERQRIFIAICLSFCPEVLILDEPTSALDGATAHQLMHQLTTFTKEQDITLVVISHDKAIMEKYQDHVISCQQGGKNG
ncbi:MAG: ATP-binding cassette domain-containing protein [Clostridia bacterium]|nr:ATP-binding cassette domain-containing protein [Clostridia bacterium]